MQRASRNWVILLNFRSASDCVQRVIDLRRDSTDIGLLLVDNGSGAAESESLRDFVSKEGGHVIEGGEQEQVDLAVIRAIQRGFCLLLVLMERNLGYSGGNNVGLHALYAALGRELRAVVLNPDVQVRADQVAALCALPATVAGPAVHEEYANGVVEPCLEFDFEIGFPKRQRILGESVRVGPVLSGCCLMLGGEALEVAGYLPVENFLYEEEVSYFSRLAKSRLSIRYEKAIVVRHAGSKSVGKHGFNYFYYIFRNRLVYFLAEPDKRISAWVSFAYAYFRWWTAVARRQIRVRNAPGLKGLWLGLLHGLLRRSGPYQA